MCPFSASFRPAIRPPKGLAISYLSLTPLSLSLSLSLSIPLRARRLYMCVSRSIDASAFTLLAGLERSLASSSKLIEASRASSEYVPMKLIGCRCIGTRVRDGMQCMKSFRSRRDPEKLQTRIVAASNVTQSNISPT